MSFLILAILVSVLYNMRVFPWQMEYGFTDELRPRIYYALFNFIIEGDGVLVNETGEETQLPGGDIETGIHCTL